MSQCRHSSLPNYVFPVPLNAMNVLPDEDLQSMFRNVHLTQSHINRVETIEKGWSNSPTIWKTKIWQWLRRFLTIWERIYIKRKSVWISCWRCNGYKSPGASSSIFKTLSTPFDQWKFQLNVASSTSSSPVAGCCPTRSQSVTATVPEKCCWCVSWVNVCMIRLIVVSWHCNWESIRQIINLSLIPINAAIAKAHATRIRTSNQTKTCKNKTQFNR